MAPMGWKQFVRSAQAAARRSERAALRRHRELQREYERQLKSSQRQQAADEVSRFENYLALLVTVHADCGEAWDWVGIAATPPPLDPPPRDSYQAEAFARAAFEAYRPGFFDRLFGQDKKQWATLEEAVRAGAAADQQAHELARAAHRKALEQWQATRQLAAGVRRLDLAACRHAIERVGAFDELQAFKTRVSLESIGMAGGAAGAVLRCHLEDRELIPKEELKLTAGGKVSTKDMAIGRYWALYQDHVCSCAIRVARETFAVLPVRVAVVNVQSSHLDPGTGHVVPITILAVRITREGLAALNLDSIDPSAAVQKFLHRSGFRRTGVQGIEPLHASAGEASGVPVLAPAAATAVRASDVIAELDEEIEEAIEAIEDAPEVAALDEVGDRADAPVVAAARADARESVQAFTRWLTAHLEGKPSAGFKLKTLVNQLGHFRASSRLSLKAVQDLAAVLAEAGFELDPDLRAATRSPGIEARVRVLRAQDAERRRTDARRETERWNALLGFLWGAGFRRLYLTGAPGRPLPEAPAVESVPELVRAVQADPERHMGVLEHLVTSGLLESWLEAQSPSLSRLAFGIRQDAAPKKGERWYRAAAQTT
jgi:hypothetical protein